MASKRELSRIDPRSVATTIGGPTAVIAGILLVLGGMAGAVTGRVTAGSAYGFLLAAIYAALAVGGIAVLAAVYAAIYNAASDRFGGIEVVVE